MKRLSARPAIAFALMVGCSAVAGAVAGAEAEAEAEDGAQGAWAFTAGAQADDQDARAVQAGLSYALSDVAWLSADAGFTRQATPPGESAINTRSAGLGLDYDFGRLGVLLDAGYWGDSGELTRNSLVTGVYTSTDTARFTVQGFYRDYKLTARIPDDQGNLSDVREFEMSGTGIGAALRLNNDGWFGGLRAAWFDYSRDPRIFRSRVAYRFLSLSALTLANSFIDYRAEASLGFELGLKSVEFELSSARSAVDDADIRTFTMYFVAPMSERVDVELSAGINKTDGLDSSAFAGLALTWFGR